MRCFVKLRAWDCASRTRFVNHLDAVDDVVVDIGREQLIELPQCHLHVEPELQLAIVCASEASHRRTRREKCKHFVEVFPLAAHHDCVFAGVIRREDEVGSLHEDDDDDGCTGCPEQIAKATDDADAGGVQDHRRGGETLRAPAVFPDNACTEEGNASEKLTRQTGRITDFGSVEDDETDHGDQASGGADQHVGTHTSHFVALPALHAEQGAEHD